MDDFDLNDFDGVCRLFPLPGVVQFPHSVLPLHVFEPRYRQLTEDALASDNFITIVQLRPVDELLMPGVRAIEKYGCLGRIIRHQRLHDGRFRILLHGLCRVRLTSELASPKLYRLAQGELVGDLVGEGPSPSPETLARSFREFILKNSGTVDRDMESLLSSPLSLGVLTDIMGHALPLPPDKKQILLEKQDPRLRANMIMSWISDILNPGRSESPDKGLLFPPPFSVN